MGKGQVFSTDLVVSLIAVTAFIGLVVAGSDAFLQNSSSTVDSVKLHQIAADAAAVRHYEQYDSHAQSADYGGLATSAKRLGYTIAPADGSKFQACMSVSRGSKDKETSVVVCR